MLRKSISPAIGHASTLKRHQWDFSNFDLSEEMRGNYMFYRMLRCLQMEKDPIIHGCGVLDFGEQP